MLNNISNIDKWNAKITIQWEIHVKYNNAILLFNSQQNMSIIIIIISVTT